MRGITPGAGDTQHANQMSSNIHNKEITQVLKHMT